MLQPLYPLTEPGNPHGWSHLELARRFLSGGVRLFQVRDKHAPDAAIYPQLVEIRKLCEQRESRFILNDRVELAASCGAHGVHLGQRDMPAAEARRLLGARALIGLSTHNREQFEDAQEQPVDYLALGPVFATGSKRDADPAVGAESFRELAAASRLPVVAIGGITLENAPDLWRAGAVAVAVIADVACAADPERRVRQYLALARDVC